MRNLRKHICLFAAFALLLCSLTACDNKPVKNVKTYENDYVIEHYTKDFPEYEKIEYEQIVWTAKYFDIGPHEPRYRGVITLTEEAAAALREKYEWKEVSEPSIEFDALDVKDLGDGPWLTCEQFKKDAVKFVNVSGLYFDGRVIIFDFQVI
ncbi:MAG: hypothetical protein J6X14_09380 [Lachnospiraceae bacterium]|nr:hypothetical protein [Lachnospiraceae bacterium]